MRESPGPLGRFVWFSSWERVDLVWNKVHFPILVGLCVIAGLVILVAAYV
jgi:hypothetical protein